MRQLLQRTKASITSQITKARSRAMAAPPLLRAAVLIGAVLLTVFFASLTRSTAGEIAGALGSLIGGIVGAGGAVWAVFLLLSRQQAEESAKVADAVRTEVTALAKYITGAIEICATIKNGLKMPRQDVHHIVQYLSDPIVYPAVADRVGLLAHPHATTEFYMRLLEVKSMVELFRTHSAPSSGFMHTSTPQECVSREFVEALVESLVTALTLARIIIDNEGDPSSKSQLDSMLQATVLRQIDDCLKSAKETFPDAESFQVPPPPQ